MYLMVRGLSMGDLRMITYRNVWRDACKTGNFTGLDDDFFDSLAAIEELVQRERIVEHYIVTRGYAPEPILTQPLKKPQ